MKDQYTSNRYYPLPHVYNRLTDDVERIRDAFSSIDGDVNAILKRLDDLERLIKNPQIAKDKSNE